jgi:hypothetical protein
MLNKASKKLLIKKSTNQSYSSMSFRVPVLN